MKHDENLYRFDSSDVTAYEALYGKDDQPDLYTAAIIEGCARTVLAATNLWSNLPKQSAQSFANFLARQIRELGPLRVNGVKAAHNVTYLAGSDTVTAGLEALIMTGRPTEPNWPPTVHLKEDVLTEELFEPPKIAATTYHELMRLHERVGGSIFREAAELIRSQEKEISRLRSRPSGMPEDD